MAGRPTEYNPEYHNKIALMLYSKGFTDDEVADVFNVHVSTLHRWKSDHPEFCDPLKAGKDFVDDLVEKSLFERATGYKHRAVKIFQYEGVPLEVPYTEHYAPDVNAIKLWLMNRRPDKWREKQEVSIDSQSSIRIINDANTDDSNIEFYRKPDAGS